MLRIISCTLSVILFFYSCSSERPVLNTENMDLEAVLDSSVSETLDGLGYDVHVLLLETTENAYLPKNSHIAHVSDSDILINGSRLLYRFGTDGKFKNTIGRIGQGPYEHAVIASSDVDADNGNILIYDGNKRIIEWSSDGQPIREVALKSDGYIIKVLFQNGHYWAEERTNSNDNTERTSIVLFDGDGNRQEEYPICTNKLRCDISYRPAPIVRKTGETIHYYNNYNTTLYKCDTDSVNELMTMNFGKYAQTGDRINDMASRKAEAAETAETLDFILCEDDLFLLMRKGNSLFCSVIDASGSCKVSCPISDPRKGGGIALCKDLDINFWPQSSRGKKLFALHEIHPDSESYLWVVDHVVNREIALTDDANPCVIIATKTEK